MHHSAPAWSLVNVSGSAAPPARRAHAAVAHATDDGRCGGGCLSSLAGWARARSRWTTCGSCARDAAVKPLHAVAGALYDGAPWPPPRQHHTLVALPPAAGSAAPAAALPRRLGAAARGGRVAARRRRPWSGARPPPVGAPPLAGGRAAAGGARRPRRRRRGRQPLGARRRAGGGGAPRGVALAAAAPRARARRGATPTRATCATACACDAPWAGRRCELERAPPPPYPLRRAIKVALFAVAAVVGALVATRAAGAAPVRGVAARRGEWWRREGE